MQRAAQIAAHVGQEGMTSTSNPLESAAQATAAQVEMDMYGNAWHVLSTGAIMRTDCYVSQPWSLVEPPEGCETCRLLCVDGEGYVWVSDGSGLWRLDSRNSDSNAPPQESGRGSAPTAQLPVAFSAGFGIWERFPASSLPAVGGPGSIMSLARGGGDGWACLTFSDGTTLEVNVRPTAVTSSGDGVSGGFGEPIARQPTLPSWSQHWREVARLPGGGNHDVFCAALGDEIFVAGGLTDWWGFPAATHVFQELWAYNPAADRWRVASRIPYGTCYCGLAVLAGKVWVVGGADDRSPGHRPAPPASCLVSASSTPAQPAQWVRGINTVLGYDPKADQWTEAPALAQVQQEAHPGYGPFALSAGGRLYAITMAHASMCSWAPGETEWRTERPPPKPLHQISGAQLGGKLYVVCQDGAFCFDPTAAGAAAWRALPQLPVCTRSWAMAM
jgi:hypothetical protein